MKLFSLLSYGLFIFTLFLLTSSCEVDQVDIQTLNEETPKLQSVRMKGFIPVNDIAAN